MDDAKVTRDSSACKFNKIDIHAAYISYAVCLCIAVMYDVPKLMDKIVREDRSGLERRQI